MYTIKRELSDARRRRTGRRFTKGLALQPGKDKYGRWDLRVQLQRPRGTRSKKKHFWTTYHRLVGLTLNEAVRGPNGYRLVTPRLIHASEWDDYEVDHVGWDPFDCRTSRLLPRPEHDHRSVGRDGWNLHRRTM